MLNTQPAALADCIAKSLHRRRQNIKSCIQMYWNQYKRETAQIERNRPLIAMLDAQGFNIHLGWQKDGEDFDVYLGRFGCNKRDSRRLAGLLRHLRQIIDCKLGQPEK